MITATGMYFRMSACNNQDAGEPQDPSEPTARPTAVRLLPDDASQELAAATQPASFLFSRMFLNCSPRPHAHCNS